MIYHQPGPLDTFYDPTYRATNANNDVMVVGQHTSIGLHPEHRFSSVEAVYNKRLEAYKIVFS